MKPHTLRLTALVFSLGLASIPLCQQARASTGSIAVYAGSQVEVPEATFFSFDDNSIPFRRNLHLTMVAPEKHGAPVLEPGPEGSFDELRTDYYGTVIKVNGRYRMWYLGYGFSDPKVRIYDGVGVRIGYAESPDGIHWTKPNLGLVNFHGNKNNNIVAIEPEDPTSVYPDRNIHVLYEPQDPDPSRRYKMMMYVPYASGRWPGKDTMVPLLSADGLHWRFALPVKLVMQPVRNMPQMAPQPRFDQSSIVMPPEHLEGGGLVNVGGIYYENGQNLNLPDGTNTGRVMSTFWSSDFIHWNPEKALSLIRYGADLHKFAPGVIRDVLLHPDGEQVHEGSALWNRGNVLVGIYGRWQGGTEGIGHAAIDLGLITSVDAIHFSEPDPNFIFIAHGNRGQWDSGGVLQGQGFQNIGGKTYFWYGNWDLTASGNKFNYITNLLNTHGYVGLATLREDGFGYFSVLDPKAAKLQETYESGEGSLITAAFRVNGGPARVLVNVDSLTGGGLTAQLLDAQARPVPGYDFSDFVPLAEGGIRQSIAWKGHPGIPAGGPYRLRVAMSYQQGGSPKLYAIYVDASP